MRVNEFFSEERRICNSGTAGTFLPLPVLNRATSFLFALFSFPLYISPSFLLPEGNQL